MSFYLGFDTSNYTTSAALFDVSKGEIFQCKKLLPVAQGSIGLRQSDAVFHHTIQLPEITQKLFESVDMAEIKGVAASDRPRRAEGSYMPCFNVGIGAAKILSSAMKIPVSFFSHQQGHIAAALFSAGKTELLKERFIAFHVSGGTTEAVLVEPNEECIFDCRLIASSLDLKAGQAIDRVGVMLGLNFPAGAELEKLALKSDRQFKIKPSAKDNNISLSGVENKCRKMLDEGEAPCDIALFCIESVRAGLEYMARRLKGEYGDIPMLFAGGVMSNSMIRERFENEFGAYFAEPVFSSDNAAGIAYLSALSSGEICL